MSYPVFSDEYFMNEALKQAEKAFKGEEIPVGAIVVNGNKPYTAYLTVIDPSSQDPVFVMPQ